MAAGSVASAALTPPPMNAQQTAGGSSFDSSGWNVNVGAGATQTSTATRTASALSGLLANPLALVLLAFVAYELAKHK